MKETEVYLVTHLMESEFLPAGTYMMPVFNSKELAELYMQKAETDDELELVYLNDVGYIK